MDIPIPLVVRHLILLLLFVLDLQLIQVVSTRNISLGTSLSAGDSSPWKSPSGRFAFGFYPIVEDLFLLSIWYDIPSKTIVWYANGKDPVPRGSKVHLTDNGKLELNDAGGRAIWWKPDDASKSNIVRRAAMQDDGNFVLLDEKSNTIWESFKDPTDTILPGQILSRGTKLTSRQSQQNFSSGRFEFHLQNDGNLVLYTVSMLTKQVELDYWASYTKDANSQLIFNASTGDIYLQDQAAGTIIRNLTAKEQQQMKDVYRLARLDYDGVFRVYEYYGEVCNYDLKAVKIIPEDICLAITGYTSSGACGSNSYCNSSKNGDWQCFCPESYSFINPTDRSQGCRPNFPLPSCSDIGWETDIDSVEFKEYNNTDWPFSDYEHYEDNGMNKEKCKELCLQDCFCAAAIFKENNCWKKKYPLSNGRQSPKVDRIAFVKVPKGNGWKGQVANKDFVIIVISTLLGSSVFLNMLLLLIIALAVYLSYHKKLLQSASISSSATNVRSYSYKELEQATGGFTQTLGRGAFGTVYKGVLTSDPRRFIAVKKLDKIELQGEKEFRTEVRVIGQTHHKNLVRLLGFCDEGEHKLLVYEYMSNGSLASFLFGLSRPNWNQRVQIAVGIARGLMYLHEECSTQIIHCDIKPQNILLDDYFTPRISDFGLAKLLLAEQTRAARTGIRGTVGYFAPEWFRRASITVKVDVYSFGMMLLEIICCTSSVVFAMGNQEEALMDYVYSCYKEKRLDKLAENDEEARNDMKRVERLVVVALWCIQEDASLRPTMKKVTQMLEEVTPVSVPPCPWNYSHIDPTILW